MRGYINICKEVKKNEICKVRNHERKYKCQVAVMHYELSTVHLHACSTVHTWSAGVGQAAASVGGWLSPSPQPALSGCAGTVPPSCLPPPRPHSAGASESGSSGSSGEQITDYQIIWLVYTT